MAPSPPESILHANRSCSKRQPSPRDRRSIARFGGVGGRLVSLHECALFFAGGLDQGVGKLRLAGSGSFFRDLGFHSPVGALCSGLSAAPFCQIFGEANSSPRPTL